MGVHTKEAALTHLSLPPSDVDEGDVDILLRRAVGSPKPDPSELARSLAQPSDFEDSGDERVAQVGATVSVIAGAGCP